MEQTDAQVRRLIIQKLREHKREVKLEDFKEYIELFCPEKKANFKKLCLEMVPIDINGKVVSVYSTDEDGNFYSDDEKGNRTNYKKSVRPFLTIKKEFYANYFVDDAEKSRRENLFSDWN